MQYNRLILYILRKLVYRKFRISHIIAFTRYNSARKFGNFLICNIERLARKTTLKSRPYLINSEPTNKCMLHCPFCPTGKSNSRKNGYANLQIFDNIFNEIAAYTYIITFHGWGEPLLHKDLPRFIDLAHRHRICTVVTSNGILLDKGTAEKFISSKLDVLYISIDGVSEDTYRKYRVGGNLKKVFCNIENLVALKKAKNSSIPFIEWQFIVFRHNQNEIKKAKDLAKKLGVDSIVFLPAYTEDPAYEPSDPKFRLPQFSPLTKPSDCKHLWSTLSLHWDGTVVPCCNDYTGNTAYGNAKQFSMKQIWNNTKFKASRSMVKSGFADERDHIPCTTCINNIV